MLQSVAYPDGHQGLSAHVDPDFPDNWLLPPYHAQLKRWAVKAQQHTKAVGPIYFVLAVVHRRNFLILPDRDIDLGDFEGRDKMEIERRVSNGRIEVLARKKGEPSCRVGENVSAFVVSP